MKVLPYEETVGELLLASRRCELVALEQLQAAVRLVGRIRALVHQIQLERGISTLHLSAHNEAYAERLRHAREAADAALGAFAEELAGWLQPGACAQAQSRLLARVALALQGFSALASLRAQVEERAILPMAAMHRYSDLIRGLLAAVVEAADAATDPDVSRALVALLNFMQGKELAGQERAIGAAGFGAGGFEAEQRQALVHRIDAQERCFATFLVFVAEEDRAAWNRLQRAPQWTVVERLRRRACTPSAPSSPGAMTALLGEWFDCTTALIDGMRTIEDRLERHLGRCCAARIAACRADLGAVRERIAQRTATELRDAVPYAVFFDAQPQVPPGRVRDEILNLPIVGHSVMELVQRQAGRLQSMEDELQAARQALGERKVIERAKGLLMRHRGLSEDQAYKLLRQTAMEQNRRLVDVAEAAVAMADLLR